MNKLVKKFLEENSGNANGLSEDGTSLIALKPICKALAINYNRQFRNVKEDPFLSKQLVIQPMIASDSRFRRMLCLPEKYIYGYIFNIRSQSKVLHDFQYKCYEHLYNHFRGSLTNWQHEFENGQADDDQFSQEN